MTKQEFINGMNKAILFQERYKDKSCFNLQDGFSFHRGFNIRAFYNDLLRLNDTLCWARTFYYSLINKLDEKGLNEFRLFLLYFFQDQCLKYKFYEGF